MTWCSGWLVVERQPPPSQRVTEHVASDLIKCDPHNKEDRLLSLFGRKAAFRDHSNRNENNRLDVPARPRVPLANQEIVEDLPVSVGDCSGTFTATLHSGEYQVTIRRT